MSQWQSGGGQQDSTHRVPNSPGLLARPIPPVGPHRPTTATWQTCRRALSRRLTCLCPVPAELERRRRIYWSLTLSTLFLSCCLGDSSRARIGRMVLSLSRESETALGTRAAAALSLLQACSPRGIPCRRHVYRTISTIYSLKNKKVGTSSR